MDVAAGEEGEGTGKEAAPGKEAKTAVWVGRVCMEVPAALRKAGDWPPLPGPQHSPRAASLAFQTAQKPLESPCWSGAAVGLSLPISAHPSSPCAMPPPPRAVPDFSKAERFIASCVFTTRGF